MNDISYKERSHSQLTFQSNFIAKVYGWMAIALVITAFVAFFVATSSPIRTLIFGNRFVFWGLLIAEIVLVFVISGALKRLSPVAISFLFLLYSVLNGVVMSFIFLVYTKADIAMTFFITAGTFELMSIYGFVTKQDLTKVGNLLFMGLIGVIIAIVVNLFLKSSTLQWIITIVGIIVFVGLISYDTQKLKQIGEMEIDPAMKSKLSIMWALSLYLYFIHLFLLLLQLFGGGRRD